MSETRTPRVTRPEHDRTVPPYCHLCGVEYRRTGCGPSEYNPGVRLDYYEPNCECWKAAPTETVEQSTDDWVAQKSRETVEHGEDDHEPSCRLSGPSYEVGSGEPYECTCGEDDIVNRLRDEPRDDWLSDGSLRCNLCYREPCQCGVPTLFREATWTLRREAAAEIERLRARADGEDDIANEVYEVLKKVHAGEDPKRYTDYLLARLRRSAPREVVGYFSEVDWGDGRGWIRAPQQYDKRSHAVQSILDAMGYDDCPPNARGRIIPLHDGTPEPVGPPIGEDPNAGGEDG